MTPDEIDIDSEMRKEPEDRTPGTDAALLSAALEFGRSTGVQITQAQEDELLALLRERVS